MRLSRWALLAVFSATIFSLSFSGTISHKDETARYYDRQLDTLLTAIKAFQHTAHNSTNKQQLTASLFACRNAYKKAEFLIDVFDPFRARLLNGPDLLKIEEENPSDSMKPHGLQVLEDIVYGKTIDKPRLEKELTLFAANVSRFRNDPDRIYYFKDDKIWQGARLGIFRIISLGLTGFDVPQSNHALPETRCVLAAIYKVTGYYKKDLPDVLRKRGDTLFNDADRYLAANTDFNTFNRAWFIREHINKISAWLAICSKQLGVINYGELNPLNAEAISLFDTSIMNLAFFSPDKKYAITADRVALGKKLFYDKRLSGDGSRSCASCHQPQKGFADGLPKPTNLSGTKQLLRNTPTLWNTALQTRQFYDSRTETLENQLSAVVHNTDEMNGSLESSVPRLIADTAYFAAFHKAYPGDRECISHYNIANAISSYVRSLISLNSRFDRYMRHESDSFSTAEKNGFNLFMGKAKCGTCHYAPVFNGLVPPLYQETESEILAVPATNAVLSELDNDPGKAKFTGVSLHRHAFKTSTVRNAALTAPYMHNGVFKTLEEVVDFYNDGGGAGRGIDLDTQTLPADKLHLSAKEKKDIIAFLNALTDTSGSSIAAYHIQ